MWEGSGGKGGLAQKREGGKEIKRNFDTEITLKSNYFICFYFFAFLLM